RIHDHVVEVASAGQVEVELVLTRSGTPVRVVPVHPAREPGVRVEATAVPSALPRAAKDGEAARRSTGTGAIVRACSRPTVQPVLPVCRCGAAALMWRCRSLRYRVAGTQLPAEPLIAVRLERWADVVLEVAEDRMRPCLQCERPVADRVRSNVVLDVGL